MSEQEFATKSELDKVRAELDERDMRIMSDIVEVQKFATKFMEAEVKLSSTQMGLFLSLVLGEVGLLVAVIALAWKVF